MCVFIFIIITIIFSLFHCLLVCRFYIMVLCIYCSHVCSYPRQISQFIVETIKNYVILSYLILHYLYISFSVRRDPRMFLIVLEFDFFNQVPLMIMFLNSWQCS